MLGDGNTRKKLSPAYHPCKHNLKFLVVSIANIYNNIYTVQFGSTIIIVTIGSSKSSHLILSTLNGQFFYNALLLQGAVHV